MFSPAGRRRKGDRPPARQLTVASIAGRAAAAVALCCRNGLQLSAPVRCGAITGGGGGSRGQMHPITRQTKRVSVSLHCFIVTII